MQIAQTVLPLTIKYKRAECGRLIKEDKYGRACKKRIMDFILTKFICAIDKKYWPLIKEFLESEGV